MKCRTSQKIWEGIPSANEDMPRCGLSFILNFFGLLSESTAILSFKTFEINYKHCTKYLIIYMLVQLL